MISIITGQPGNGKTLMGLSLMAAEYERNMAAVKAGREQPRRFFSNVKGVTTEDNPGAFPWVERMPAHNDWTQLPDGSFVQLDEAHSDGKTPGLEPYGLLFPSTGRPGESDDARIRAMSTHRHRGFDLQLITQWPSKIHHQVRTLCNEHVHMSRAFGLERAGVLKWSRVQADPYDEDQREKAEETIWPYPKGLYARYVSATLHTASHRFKMPAAVWKGLSMLVVAGLIGWAFLSWVQRRGEEDTAKARANVQDGGQERAAPAQPAGAAVTVPASAAGTGRFFPLSAPAAPKIVGYVDSARGCRMWNSDGDQLDISDKDCRAMVDQGVPLYFVASRESSREKSESADAGAGWNPAAMAASAAVPSSGEAVVVEQVAAYGGFR